MANRKRPIEVKFHVTPEERTVIEKRMAQAGTMNMAAYLRKMAIDGYILKLDLPELRELVTLTRRYAGSLNQIAKRVNATDRFYSADLAEMKESQEHIWAAINEVMMRLSAVG